jgi:hypothetical protein
MSAADQGSRGAGDVSTRSFRLTSLLLVEERVREAGYFVRRLRRHRNPTTFGYELNAFLSAARSITFLLQKELNGVFGFPEWWSVQQERLRKDEVARFFLELRNFSQKEGRVATVGSGSSHTRYWHFLFTGTATSIPAGLLGRDVVDCCQEYLSKLAGVVLECSEAFPWHSCPARALTDAGVEALGVDLDAVDAILGYPPGWTNLMEDRSGRIAVQRRHVDAVDFDFIRRVANHRPRANPTRDAITLKPRSVLPLPQK